MELRRALLLFAIVLGVAAVVAAIAGPAPQRSRPTTAAPPPTSAAERRARRPAAPVRVDGRGAAVTRKIEVGRATTVMVAVDEPGQVELEGLGLIEAAQPRDPAVFETLLTRPGRHEVVFTPAGGVRARALGELVSRPAK